MYIRGRVRCKGTVDLVWGPIFGGLERFKDKEHVRKAYEAHLAEVKRVVPPGQLLVWNPMDGWGPLCAFLGKEPPADGAPFPWVNEASEFRKKIKGLEVLQRELEVATWVQWGLVAAAAGVVVALVARSRSLSRAGGTGCCTALRIQLQSSRAQLLRGTPKVAASAAAGELGAPDDGRATLAEFLNAKLDTKFSEQNAKLDAKFSDQDAKLDAKLDAKFSDQDAKLDAKLDAKFKSVLPQRSEADLDAAVAALLDWLAEEDRGFLAVVVAEIQQQIALLQRAGPEQVEGGLAQVRTCNSRVLDLDSDL
eukprot:XP_001694667.1 predicted protein [Chlamydomonas reinhardtii]